ncbi:hypothetical protein TRFO_21980 [Tritrichomonas foetus]|uniref:Sel1 repeat family protein n=1 Tax=Tritrichomonas foetus TaxID=1144522 RepID=A0A1J4KE93_9EUKA|nr:hypothetical protein TRFO_21980 [Tritrichomonas foetus]|eukprot:OHT09232.1 hypothetical protein TRFO_21980 [Tritrichomonas foetus]
MIVRECLYFECEDIVFIKKFIKLYIYQPKPPRKKVELQLAPPSLPYQLTDTDEINKARPQQSADAPMPKMRNQLTFLTPQEIYQIGKSFYRDLHSIEDLEQAFIYFKTAAEMGYPPAQNKYAYCIDQVLNPESSKSEIFRHFDIDTRENNLKEMIKFYTLAADQNHKRALNNLAVCYIQGSGVAPDPEKALSLLKRSKDLGDRLGTRNYESFTRNYKSPKKNLEVKYG